MVGTRSVGHSLSAIANYLATATLAAGTITTSQPMTLTQTWNAGGVTFRGKENVFTITASAAGSTLERWLGGTGGATAQVAIHKTDGIQVYGAYTDESNYERLNIGTSLGATTPGVIFSQAGTGVQRNTYFGSTGAGAGSVFLYSNGVRWEVSPGGNFLAGSDDTYNIGAVGATRPKNIYLAGFLAGSIQSLSGAGAVNLTTWTTAFTSTGAGNALTLADGAVGQIKYIVHVADGGSGVLTPTNLFNGTTITFTNLGDSCVLQFIGTEWHVISLNGAALA